MNLPAAVRMMAGAVAGISVAFGAVVYANNGPQRAWSDVSGGLSFQNEAIMDSLCTIGDTPYLACEEFVLDANNAYFTNARVVSFRNGAWRPVGDEDYWQCDVGQRDCQRQARNIVLRGDGGRLYAAYVYSEWAAEGLAWLRDVVRMRTIMHSSPADNAGNWADLGNAFQPLVGEGSETCEPIRAYGANPQPLPAWSTYDRPLDLCVNGGTPYAAWGGYSTWGDYFNETSAAVCRGGVWSLIGGENFSRWESPSGNRGGDVMSLSLCVDAGVPYLAFDESDPAEGLRRGVTVMRWDAAGRRWSPLGTRCFTIGVDGEVSRPVVAVSGGVVYVLYSIDDWATGSRTILMKYTGNGGTGWEQVGRDPVSDAGGAGSLCFFDGVPYVAYVDYDRETNAPDGAPHQTATVRKYNGARDSWMTVGELGIPSGYVNKVLISASARKLFVAYDDLPWIGPAPSQIKIASYDAARKVDVYRGGNYVSPGGSHDFGDLFCNSTSVPSAFSIENNGGSNLRINSVTVGGADANAFVIGDAVGNLIAPGRSVSFDLRFLSGSVGTKTATVTIATDDPILPSYTFTVRGRSTAPDINVTRGGVSLPSGAGRYSFGAVRVNDRSAAAEFVVANTGTAVLVLEGATLSGAGANQFAITVRPGELVIPGGSTTLAVQYAPTSTGAKIAVVSIPSNDPDEDPYLFEITGTGVVPDIAVSTVVNGRAVPVGMGAVYPFGSVKVGAVADAVFTVQNTGNSKLALSGWPISGQDKNMFRVTQNPALTVLDGGRTTVTVRFAPASPGAKMAAISITSNDPDENPYTINLAGTGIK